MNSTQKQRDRRFKIVIYIIGLLTSMILGTYILVLLGFNTDALTTISASIGTVLATCVTGYVMAIFSKKDG